MKYAVLYIALLSSLHFLIHVFLRNHKLYLFNLGAGTVSGKKGFLFLFPFQIFLTKFCLAQRAKEKEKGKHAGIPRFQLRF